MILLRRILVIGTVAILIGACWAVISQVGNATGPAHQRQSAAACDPANCAWTGTTQHINFDSPTAGTLGRSAPRVQTSPGLLSVHVEGLPARLRANVSIVSPTGAVRHTGTALTIRRADPGTWTVTVRRVVTSGTTYFPVVQRTIAHLAPGAHGVITADYVDALNNSTLRVYGSQVLAAPVPAADSSALKGGTRCNVPGAYALITVSAPSVTTQLTISKVIVVTQGRYTPSGLIMKRECGKVTTLANGDAETWGVNAPLDDIGPFGVLSSGQRTATRTLPGATSPLPGGLNISDGKDYQRPFCGAGAGASVTAGAGLSPVWALAIHWNLLSPHKMRASASVHGSLTAVVAADLTAKVSCSWDDPRLLGPAGFDLGTYVFSIGVFPIVVVPSLNIYANVTASASAAANIGAEETIGFSAHAAASLGTVPELSVTLTKPKFTPLHDLKGGASLSALFGPTLSFNIDNLGGPRLDLLGKVLLATGSATRECTGTDVATPPPAVLCSGIVGGIQATFDVFSVATTVGHVDDLYHSRLTTLWSAPLATPHTRTPQTYTVSLATLCANAGVTNAAQNGCPYDGTTTVGTRPLPYEALVVNNNQSLSPSFWDLINFPSTTCSVVHITFGIPSGGGSPGDVAYLQVAQGSTHMTSQASYGHLGTLSVPLSNEQWSLNNSATSTNDEIAINLSATCATPSGFPR